MAGPGTHGASQWPDSMLQQWTEAVRPLHNPGAQLVGGRSAANVSADRPQAGHYRLTALPMAALWMIDGSEQ
jgi:hypothetical protein